MYGVLGSVHVDLSTCRRHSKRYDRNRAGPFLLYSAKGSSQIRLGLLQYASHRKPTLLPLPRDASTLSQACHSRLRESVDPPPKTRLSSASAYHERAINAVPSDPNVMGTSRNVHLVLRVCELTFNIRPTVLNFPSPKVARITSGTTRR